ncbi:DUF2927 domain-containing protein [Roseivivax sediminis]|uniref:DUF2927 domain-containing protein n=1 Tax=Roseivivax sediminis TaxID=936889 RepID=A0A1I2AXC5_9RHOB|nr:DUF2927 domain-containing protein [Roseivivax sediminis]SFE48476.1 Protein of unknown function [Roseivivax sediminis]
MVRRGRPLEIAAAALLAVALAGCDASVAPAPPAVKPEARPARPAPAAEPETPPAPSQRSAELASYYARLERDLVGQGLLRTDGGGPDTPVTDTRLARDFERIALAEEYERGAGLRPSSGALGRVKRWQIPVRVDAEFGASVDAEAVRRETGTLRRYVDRLARVTGHPITMSPTNPNFHVLFMSEDDRSNVAPRVKELVPDIDGASLAVLQTLPREIHCLVIAFSDKPGGYSYGRAVALVRAEHPNLLMKSCIHEEVAQGLGLANDSPQARPSIFNDDDEFALLTTHDEMLLEILYDPRLRAGMTAEEARPIVREIATELVGERVASVATPH